MKLHGILFELYKADREMKTADNAKIFQYFMKGWVNSKFEISDYIPIRI